MPVDVRQNMDNDFTSQIGSAVLILNPKTADTRLNVTTANHVIHYSLKWNPAVEDQATARPYRSAQENIVTVHRLTYVGTVEEVVNDRIARKRELGAI